jgi:hypothetical protein
MRRTLVRFARLSFSFIESFIFDAYMEQPQKKAFSRVNKSHLAQFWPFSGVCAKPTCRDQVSWSVDKLSNCLSPRKWGHSCLSLDEVLGTYGICPVFTLFMAVNTCKSFLWIAFSPVTIDIG